MAIGQRLYTRRLCLLPHPQRNREGGLQLGRLPEGARVSGHDALAHRMAENPEASGALGERNSVCESAPAVSNAHGRLPRTLPRARQTHSGYFALVFRDWRCRGARAAPTCKCDAYESTKTDI